MPLANGTRIGNYEILAPLGAGGMGEVYRARDQRLGRLVAIKALGEGFGADPERVARFEREARILASLHHANIAVIYGLEESGGTPYLALEFVEGETLADRLSRDTPTVTETLEIGAQIASALDAAHEQGIVHRDLKPGNVMLTPAGIVKVLDFGLAKNAPSGTDPAPSQSFVPTMTMGATAAGVILGTAPYMSPEQARGKAVDRRADIWALGCVLYECLTGRRTFEGETTSDVIARILEREPDFAALPPAAPQRLRDLVRRCLTKNVADRPRDAGDLRRELQSIAADQSSPRASAGHGPGATPSVAVLYFENIGQDPENDYFCAGITEDILTDLSKLKGLRVASRNAVNKYRGQSVDIARVAGELGVRAVLEGTIRRAGDRVRITAQLVSADGFHLWAERYDRKLDDVFAVQEEIASSIAAALKVALTPAEVGAIGGARPKDVRAYDLYLKGREEYGRRSTESLKAALNLFEQAIEVDPGYALAYAGIADVHGQMLQWGLAVDPKALIERGLAAGRRAVELNPKLPEGHKALALVLQNSGDREGSAAALKAALAVDPRFVPAITNLAVERVRGGDIAGGERLFRRSLTLEPDGTFAMLWMSVITDMTGRPEEAERLRVRVLELTSEKFFVTAVQTQRAWASIGRGRAEELAQLIAEGRAAGCDAASLAVEEAFLAARTDDAPRARELLRDPEGSHELGLLAIFFAAATAMRLGELERALDFVKRTVIHYLAPVMLRLEPRLHPLLDFEPFAPRRSDLTLVWPLEAPMMSPAVHGVFREVRIESGLAEASDISAAR